MPHDMPQYLIVLRYPAHLKHPILGCLMDSVIRHPPPHPLENFYLFYLCTQVVKIEIIKHFDDNK